MAEKTSSRVEPRQVMRPAPLMTIWQPTGSAGLARTVCLMGEEATSISNQDTPTRSGIGLTGSWRANAASNYLDTATHPPFAIDHLATFGGAHSSPETDLASAFHFTDSVRVMHREIPSEYCRPAIGRFNATEPRRGQFLRQPSAKRRFRGYPWHGWSPDASRWSSF